MPRLCANASIGRPSKTIVVHRGYAIYYLVNAAEVVIVRVIHGARDVAASAERGGFGREEPP